MTQHFHAESVAQVLRLVASGQAALQLLPPRRSMQQIAVGEISTAVLLDNQQHAVLQWFVNCGEISHCVSARLEAADATMLSATMQTWFAHGEEAPLSLLDEQERHDLEYALLHLT